MQTYITNSFIATEAKRASRVWVESTDSDHMFPVKVFAGNDRIITVELHGRKIVFTPSYGEWRADRYILAIEAA
jgi:hypothetical protein